jgi:hypothetical protein
MSALLILTIPALPDSELAVISLKGVLSSRGSIPTIPSAFMSILPPVPDETALAVISLSSEGAARINRVLMSILPPFPWELVEISLPRRRVNKSEILSLILPPLNESESALMTPS